MSSETQSENTIISGFRPSRSFPGLWHTGSNQFEACDFESKGEVPGATSWTLPTPARLSLRPNASTDFWRHTYYTPRILKDNGPALLYGLPSGEALHAVTDVRVEAKNQFDQGGLFVRFGPEHWIKAGLEFVDGCMYLSCVVTNEYSDWSTQPWPTNECALRLSQTGDGSYALEAKHVSRTTADDTDASSDVWQIVRICKLNVVSGLEARVGVFACNPAENPGCEATFWNFCIARGAAIKHSA